MDQPRGPFTEGVLYMRGLVAVATALTIVGGLNWGLVGAFDFNLVEAIFGEGSGLSRVVYIVVGVSALIALANFSYLKRDRTHV